MRISQITLRNFKSFPHTTIRLAEGFNCIVGPNGSGKCLKGDSQVLLSDGRLEPIGKLVEENLLSGEQVELDDGKLTFNNPRGLSVFSLNQATGKSEQKRIQAFVKRTSPAKLLEIETAGGRKVTATSCHPLITIRDGQITYLEAGELKAGSHVALPRTLDITPGKENLVLEFAAQETGLYLAKESCLELRKTVLERKAAARVTLKELARSSGVKFLVLKGLADGQSIPLHSAFKLCNYFGTGELEQTKLLSLVKAKNSGKTVRIPAQVSVALAKVLGYTLSEGRVAPKEVFFYNDSPEIREDFAKASSEAFGVSCTECDFNGKRFIVLPSKAVATFLESMFSLKQGGNSFSKTFPYRLLSSTHSACIAFISSLYDGDGSVPASSSGALTVEYASASRSLVEGLSLLLLRFGVQSRVSSGFKAASNTALKTRRRYYRLTAYGMENCSKMAGTLEASIIKKPLLESRLKDCEGKSATSLDLVPNCNSLIKSALSAAGYSCRKLKGVKPSRLRAYYEDRCLPSRSGMMEVVKLVSGEHKLKIEALASSDVFWDKIKEIHDVEGEQWVYDLTIADNHNFIANGLFVHNSNTIDSLLFAFGDTSLKAMRVKKTSDLIHQNNKVAEVTVGLEGKDGSTHTISRMIKRDGATRYMLDGKRVKKYGVTEFLSHHSLSMSNIIKQGEVQRIVEMNAKDRRGLLDQAANVAEYEQKKKEALSELEQVEAKLKEAATVLGEREGYLKELERERDSAIRFKDLSAQRDSVKATMLSIDVSSFESEFTSNVNSKLDLEGKLGAVGEKIAETGNHISAKNAEKDGINKEILARGAGEDARLQREVDTLNVTIESNKKLIQERSTEAKSLEERKRAKSLEHQRSADEVKGARRSLDSVEKEISALSKMVSEKAAEYDKMLGHSNAFSSQFQEARATVDKTRDEMMAVKEQLSALQAEVSKDEELVRMKERELDRLKEGAGEDFAPKLKEFNSKLSSCKTQLQNAQSELDALFGREKDLNSRLPQVEDELLHAREKTAEINSKLRNADAAVVSRALEAVLELKEKLPGVHGTVEELCTYPAKFAIPIQVAMGPRSQFVVVDSVKVASKAIEVIKERKLGRVSFIPMDKIKSNEISPAEKKLADSQGSFGFLIDHLEFDASLKRAFDFVCGNTILVNDLKTAEPFIGKIRLVTMAGEMAEQSGLLSGGSFTPKVNLAAEKRTLSEWNSKAANAAAEKDSILNSLSELRDSMSEARKRKADAELALKSVEIEIAHLKNEQDEEKRKRSDVTSALKGVNDEIESLGNTIQSANEERSKLVRRLSELNTTALEARQKMDVEKEANFGMQLKEKERALSELRVKLADYESQGKSLMSSLTVYDRTASALDKELKEITDSSTSLEASIKSLSKEITESQAQLKLKLEEQKKVSGAISELLNRRERLESEASKLANEKGKLEFERERLMRMVSEGQIRLAALEANLSQLKVQLSELSGALVIAGKGAEDKPALVVQLRGLQESIEALGGVNMRAIELYDTRLKEFDEQKLRVGQLFTEKEAVITVINAVEGKKVSTFMEMFNLVNENFKKVFSQIFPGDGHLFLENPEKPFDGGLTIEIKLTNKEVKYLELMSGGEKSLIALIFLFALQACNPSSVAILDEADAALDADNSRKLAELVRALSKDTQFIVVSHNQNVFKNAESLVGVAMSGGGSRIVEVKLNEHKNMPGVAAPVTAKN